MTSSLLVMALGFSLSWLAQAPARLPATLQNGAFQEGSLGQAPKGWLLPNSSQEAGFRCELAEDLSLPGKRCAVLVRGKREAQGPGELTQVLDAVPYRGKRVRLKAWLRLESKDRPGAAVQMFLRVDRAAGKKGFSDAMRQRPVRSTTWTPAEIVGDVASDAEQLALGFQVPYGEDKVWLGPLVLEVLGVTPGFSIEGPRPLTARGLQNLEAFTRTLNLVRFFHPSDEAARADWNRLAIEGARTVEGTASAEELATRLQGLFAPLAPSAQFLLTGGKPLAPAPPPQAGFTVRWRHLGFGQDTPPYQSLREYLPLAERASQGWADPSAQSAVALPGGVSLWLPSVLFADGEKHTLPAAAPAPASAPGLPDPTAGPSASDLDRGTRLGEVAMAWGILQHFYPYFEVTGTDWSAELSKALQAVAQDPSPEAFLHSLRCLVAALMDGHGGVYDEEASGTATPSLDLVMVEGQALVRYAGESARVVPAGSRILSVDGVPLATCLARLESEISAAGEAWRNSRLSVDLLAGAAGTTVRVAYETPTGAQAEAALPRDSTLYKLRNAGKPQSLTELRPGIWYVDLSRTSGPAFAEAVPRLAQAKGIVFDLRRYPSLGSPFLGHLTDQPIQSPQWLVPAVTLPDRRGWEWVTPPRWNIQPRAPRFTGRLAFLAGGGTISQGESLLGIVEAYKLAEIVGEPTAGTNGNVNAILLPGGLRIFFTGMKVLKHDGSRHHGVGIPPTVPQKPTRKGLAEGRDDVLEKGLEVVSR